MADSLCEEYNQVTPFLSHEQIQLCAATLMDLESMTLCQTIEWVPKNPDSGVSNKKTYYVFWSDGIIKHRIDKPFSFCVPQILEDKFSEEYLRIFHLPENKNKVLFPKFKDCLKDTNWYLMLFSLYYFGVEPHENDYIDYPDPDTNTDPDPDPDPVTNPRKRSASRS